MSTVEQIHAEGQPGTPQQLPAGSVPRHVAIIMDGNGRWAQARGLPRTFGHDAGTENIRRIVRAAVEMGIGYLTLWAFSTENWNRPADEVQTIISLIARSIERELDELDKEGAQLRHIGSLEGLDSGLAEAVIGAIERTRNNDKIVLTLAFNYGGRAEILHAVKRLLEDRVDPTTLTEEIFAQYLHTHDLPDPDLIVRTGAEHGFWPDDRRVVTTETRRRPGSSDVMALRVGHEKLTRETGWQPRVGWEEGILRTIRWYAENRERWIGRVDWLPTGAPKLVTG